MKKLLPLLFIFAACEKEPLNNCVECRQPSPFGGTHYLVICKEDVSEDDWQSMVNLVGSHDIVWSLVQGDTTLTRTCYYVD